MALSRGWRDLASRCPRARQEFFRLLLVNRRVDPVGRCALEVTGVGVAVVVGVLVTFSFLSRLAGPRAFSSFSLGLLVGAREEPQSTRVARIATGRHVASRWGGRREGGEGGGGEGDA